MPGPEAGPEALRRAAASGNPIAQFVVATNYLEDRSRAPDYANAAQWLAKAAQQGLAPAEYRLGTLYERGRGFSRSATGLLLSFFSCSRHRSLPLCAGMQNSVNHSHLLT